MSRKKNLSFRNRWGPSYPLSTSSSKEHARTAVIHFGMRKKCALPEKKTNTKDKNVVIGSKRKHYHYYHYCPIHGSMALVKRMPPHLKQMHKLQPGSHEYIYALS